MIKAKVNAGALQLTMFVVVVIALLLAAFIILVNTHNRFRIQTDFVKETISNADRGIYYTLEQDIKTRDTVLVNLQSETFKSLKIYRDNWGLYEKVHAKSQIKHNSFERVALIGASKEQGDSTALYLEDRNKPLVVVGSTKIQGVAYLPKQGVRTGNIKGHSYYGSSLIYGMKRIGQSLPNLNKETIEWITNVKEWSTNLKSDQFLDLSSKSNHQNSFLDPVKLIYDRSEILLKESSLKGHIGIRSETKIIVENTSDLRDVILVAPIIEIKDGTKGVFQAFATNEIKVGSNCRLDYPTALILNGGSATILSGNLRETASIQIGKHAQVKGQIVNLKTKSNYNPQIFIDEAAIVIGEVYCDRNLELLGSVYGSVYTSGFVARQGGSVYQNHIYNGIIEIDRLPNEYIGLQFGSENKGIAKWLY